MRDLVAKMGRHGVVFSAGLLLSRIVGFILLPILTDALETSEYGIHDLLALTGQLVAMVAAFGLPSAVFRWFVYEAKTDEERQRAIATGFRCTAITTLAFGGAVALFAPSIAHGLTGQGGFAALFVIVLITYFLQNLRNVCIAILRAEYRSTQFLIVYMAEFLLCVALNVYFVVYRDMGVAGLIWSNLIGAAVALGLALTFERRVFGPAGESGLLRKMLGFSLPLVPQALAFFLLDTIDRYAFDLLLPVGEAQNTVGLYGRGATFASIMHAVLIMPLATLWPNMFYALAKREGGQKDIGRCASVYGAVACFLAVGLSVVGRPLVELMTDVEYHSCHVVIPILAFSLVLLGACEFPRVGFMVEGRTKRLPLLVFGAVIVNAVLNVMLIPRIGLVGAAWSSVGSYAFLFVITAIFGQRLYRVEFEWSRIFRIGLITAGLLFLNRSFPPLEPAIIDLLVRGGAATILFPAGLVLLGFVRREEWEWIQSKLRRSA